MDYRAGSHSRYDLKVHVVWITKYRKKILKGDISVRIRELLREVREFGLNICSTCYLQIDSLETAITYSTVLAQPKWRALEIQLTPEVSLSSHVDLMVGFLIRNTFQSESLSTYPPHA